MEYIFNSKTNCFEGYAPQYETKIDEETGEETQILIPCTERLYTREEVDAFFAQCKDNKTLKSVNGLPTIVDRYTEDELVLITKTARIAELKAKLKETDYQAIKYAEGVMNYDDFATIRVQRQEWRDEINALEAEIAQLQ
jgi:hypothetical protein